MIQASKLYAETHDGLDIILHYYPDAAQSVHDPKRKFKARIDEKTPSAILKKYPLQNGGEVWKVTDFGDDGHALSPIDVCMKEEGLDNSRFYEAVLKLAAMFDVRDELDRSINKPEIRKEAATIDQEDGKRYFSLLKEIPEAHLKVLGPRVKKEHAEALHWHEAEWVCYVKDRVATYKYSTENYPIFLRECLVKPENKETGEKQVVFYKIYEPLNPEKQYRFSYTPEGVKPKQYINGFEELKTLWRQYNADREAKFRADPANENLQFKEEKLDEAFICSGERDSLCCKSVGYTPIWFNSETYRLSEEEYKEIMKYVKVLYNIPDIDSTGIKKGTQLALRFRDIYTMWLPNELSKFKDNRGKGRKDLRDWMEINREIKDFRNLMSLAMPARFWTEHINKKSGKKEYNIDAACLHYFLKLNGFYTLHDENSINTQYIRIEGNIVKPIRGRDIRKFIRDFAEENFLDHEIRNLILNSPRLSDSALENLSDIELDFTSFTPQSQYFYFQHSTVEVTAKEIIERKSTDIQLDRYVWERDVQPHNFKKLPPLFTITTTRDEFGEYDFDIKINGEVKSPILGYLINSSRIYWREEMEFPFVDNPQAGEAYRAAHHFDIAGEGLTTEEIKEQKINLINKIFALGYMLHRYKARSRAWATQCLDNKIGEEGQCNGRSGKSFIFQVVAKFANLVTIDGRDPKVMENRFVFDRVNQFTDFVMVDDCSKYFPIDQFYALITGDMTVNPKNNNSFSIAFEDSPKFGFSSNYVPLNFDPSTNARMLYLVFSDYYHERSEEANDYLESRSIRDDFGHDLLSKNASDEEYTNDVNLVLQCCQFYLTLLAEPIKIMPQMRNIVLRKYKAEMGENFEEWAKVYFGEDGAIDKIVYRKEAFEDFRNTTNAGKNYSMQKFTKSLKAFVAICPYIHDLNPSKYCNSQGRIIKKDDEGKAVDCIYLRSEKEYQTELSLNTNDDDTKFIPDEEPEGIPGPAPTEPAF